MKELHLFDSPLWYPLKPFGITAPWSAVNSDTVIYTWVSLLVIFILSCIARVLLLHPHNLGGFSVRTLIKGFVDLIDQSIPGKGIRYAPFIISLFFFILICNIIILIPFMEEPTKDLNTTLACALVSFLFIQKELARAHGLKHYLQDYFKMPLSLKSSIRNPLMALPLLLIKIVLNTIIALALFPIELLSKLASVMSLSFRLFGNIFAGSLIGQLVNSMVSGSVVYQTIAVLTGINLIIMGFFGIFEGLVQALVFAVLTVTYLALGLGANEEAHV
jgi:F-type H+-transporting ATPase subunit a